MDFFRQILQQISSIWKRLNPRQKLTLILSFVAFLVTLIIFLNWAAHPEYSLLYSNLSPEEAGEVIKKLKEMNVPYKLKNEGSSIFVPSSQVYEIRLNLAMEGVPQGGEVGFEIFDNTSLIGMTNFMERINYQRALQGELARTIESLQEVVRARVHLVLPEESPFVIGEEAHPRASIVLKLRPGVTLRKNQILGIAMLTAGSVKNLQVNDVTIVDQTGNILFEGNELYSSFHLTTSQLELKRKIEDYLAGKIQTLLSSVLGPGKAVVKVDARLNFDQITRTAEYYDPENKVVKSEIRREGSSEKSGSIVGGVPGAKTNLGLENSIQMANPGKEVTEESSIQYAISKRMEQIVEGVGNVEKISVAVAVDGAYQIGPKGEKKYIPRTEEEMKKITSMVKQAVGYDESRGDTITVTNIPFDISFQEEEREFSPLELIRHMGRYLVVTIVILILFLSLRKIMKLLVLEREEKAASEAKKEVIAFEDEKWLRERIFQLAEQNPGQVARIIKIWITNHGRV